MTKWNQILICEVWFHGNIYVKQIERFMVWFRFINATFNNISLSYYHGGQFYLLAEENGVPGEKHRPVASQC